MFADSHCHLDYPGLAGDQPAVLARARAAGVSAMVNIATRASEWDKVLGTAAAHADVFATVGVHPHEADGHAHIDAAALIAAAAHPKIVALGETGLDYHYDRSDRAAQRRLFREHIAASRGTGLPVVIHTRDAEADTAAILTDELARGAFPALIHCFTGSRGFAETVLGLGLSISMSGIVTFRKSTDLQATAAAIPADRLLIETDAPFLAPHPHRGRTCEPAHVAVTAAFLAKLRGVSLDALAASTTANFQQLFARVPA